MVYPKPKATDTQTFNKKVSAFSSHFFLFWFNGKKIKVTKTNIIALNKIKSLKDNITDNPPFHKEHIKRTNSARLLPQNPLSDFKEENFSEQNEPIEQYEEEKLESIKEEENQDKEEPLKKEPSQKEPSTCLICFDKNSNAVIMDCGHGGICYDCCIAMWQKNQGCYLCRKPILQVLQVEIVQEGDDKEERIKVISCTKMKQKN